MRLLQPRQKEHVPRLVMAEQDALSASDLIQIAVPAAEGARFRQGRRRYLGEFSGQFLCAVKNQGKDLSFG
jgi:hypothetical protein